MEPEEWDRCHDVVRQVLTGGDDTDEEDGVKSDRYLEVGKDDIMFAESRTKRDKRHGEISMDIDSILALFTDLSIIRTVIKVSIISNPLKNLKKSIHLSHHGIPLHWIPHFYFDEFGHDPTFDLFIFLPAQ
jgi:hypothetical protein